ncbi:MAG: hypothetical protein ACNI25_12235 [Halarcobacter sp.]
MICKRYGLEFTIRPRGRPKIKENFEYEILEEDEDILIEFKYKQGTTLNVDFNDSNCQG